MPKKKKGPDPAAIQAEQNEIMKLTREFYLRAFRKEHVRSAGHRTTQKETGAVPGFDPKPYPEIATEKLDRLIVRRNHKTAWDYQGEDDGIVVVDDRDVAAHHDSMKAALHDVNDYVYQVMSAVDGVRGRLDMDITDTTIEDTFDAVDKDGDIEYPRKLGEKAMNVSPRADDIVDTIDTLSALWDRRSTTLLDELSRHLKITPGHLTLLSTSIACRYLPANPKLSYPQILTLFLYGTDPTGLDRLLGHWSGQAPPPDYKPVSPNIAKTLCSALANRDLRVLADWVNFLVVLGTACSALPPDKLGRTLYCGVKAETMTAELRTTLQQSKADDVMYWPYLVSASLDLDNFLTEEHEVVFTIRGVTAGVDLTSCSQSPHAMEIILPPFCMMRVKSKADNRKVEVQVVGSLFGSDHTDAPAASQKRWAALLSKAGTMLETVASEFHLIQFYQMCNRRALRHKYTIAQLSQVISQVEAENEASLLVTDRTRGGKTAAAAKPEDPMAQLDGLKAGILEKHLQWTRNEQARLERELRALKNAISDGTEDLLRAESEGIVPDPSLRPLLKARTGYYNELVVHYDTDSKKSEELQARVTAMKPADTSRKARKGAKKK